MRARVEASPDLSDEDLLELYAPSSADHVRANFVQAVDGAIAVAGRSGSLGGPGDRRVFALLRALADVILVGAGTVRAENYGPAALTPPLRSWRASLHRPPVPTIAVVTATAGLDPSARLFLPAEGQPRPLVLTCEAADPGRRKALSEVAEVIACGPDAVDLPAAVATLRRAGYRKVLCEGGPLLFNQLLAADLLDDLCLTVSPQLVGPGPATLAAGIALARPVSLRLGHVLSDDGLLLCRYDVERRPS